MKTIDSSLFLQQRNLIKMACFGSPTGQYRQMIYFNEDGLGRRGLSNWRSRRQIGSPRTTVSCQIAPKISPFVMKYTLEKVLSAPKESHPQILNSDFPFKQVLYRIHKNGGLGYGPKIRHISYAIHHVYRTVSTWYRKYRVNLHHYSDCLLFTTIEDHIQLLG